MVYLPDTFITGRHLKERRPAQFSGHDFGPQLMCNVSVFIQNLH
jgi:hypothetical protein